MGISCPKFLGFKSSRVIFVKVTGLSSPARIPVSSTSSKLINERESIAILEFDSCAKRFIVVKINISVNDIGFI